MMETDTVELNKPKNLSESDINRLRRAVKPYYTDSRYAHVLSVEEEVGRLGAIFLNDKINSLRAAALLHDITKKYDYQKQLQCCTDFGIILRNPTSPEVLHAITGVVVAKQYFPEYTDNEILNGIRWHTTGRWGMTVFDSIIFLADYIEPLRTHERCISVRERLYETLNSSNAIKAKEKAFNHAILHSIDNTIAYLLSKKALIDADTVFARNYYLSEKEL